MNLSLGHRRLTLLAFMFLFTCVLLPAQDVSYRIDFPSARLAAFGGSYAALADDTSVLMGNPAGFALLPPQFSISNLSARISGPIFSMAGVVQSVIASGDVLGILTDPVALKLLKSLYTSIDINGPVYFGFVGNGIGFGIFNKSNAQLVVSNLTSVSLDVSEIVVFSGGYAFNIPFSVEDKTGLSFGLNLKAFMKATSSLETSLLEMMELIPQIATISFTNPFTVAAGSGFDLGLNLRPASFLSIGIVCKDVFSPYMANTYSTLNGFLDGSDLSPVAVQSIIPAQLDAGIQLTPHFRVLDRFISKMTFFLEYRDAIDMFTHPATASNPVLHGATGFELTFLEILNVRGGFYQGLFAAGLGIDLSFVKLDTAMFMRELSTEPGLNPVYNLMIGLDFSY